MKHSYITLNLRIILLLMAMALMFAACKKEEPKPKIDYLKVYHAPNYPKKGAGIFLKSVSNQPAERQSNLSSPYKNGVKAEFFYNAKNYVNFYKVYGTGADSIGREVRIEYNISGLVSRIKYFNLDSVIVAYELFEYSTAKQLTRISRYELASDQVTYGLASFNKFSYPAKDKMQELLYSKDMNFEHPYRDMYNFNAAGNVQKKIHYAYDAKFPSSSDTLSYDTKKRPYENLGLPVYEMNFGDFQRAEIFSKNNIITYQTSTYDNSLDPVKVGEKQSIDLKFDSLDYPVSKNDSIYYNYIELK